MIFWSSINTVTYFWNLQDKQLLLPSSSHDPKNNSFNRLFRSSTTIFFFPLWSHKKLISKTDFAVTCFESLLNNVTVLFFFSRKINVFIKSAQKKCCFIKNGSVKCLRYHNTGASKRKNNVWRFDWCAIKVLTVTWYQGGGSPIVLTPVKTPLVLAVFL